MCFSQTNYTVASSLTGWHTGVVLCDTHDTSILIVDVTIPVSPMSRHIAIYHSSKNTASIASIDATVQLVVALGNKRTLYTLAICSLYIQ